MIILTGGLLLLGLGLLVIGFRSVAKVANGAVRSRAWLLPIGLTLVLLGLLLFFVPGFFRG